MNMLYEAAKLCCNSPNPTGREINEVITVLEDGNSPIATKYVEKLYNSVISKDHIDFDDIPLSKGDIDKYRRLPQLLDTVNAIQSLAVDNHSKVSEMTNEILKSISILRKLKSAYMECFRRNNEYGIMEYNTYVYTIIQATSAILYDYVDYIKRPDMGTMEIVFRNNVMRPNKFYYEHLVRLNKVAIKPEYSRYLLTVANGDGEHFVGTATALGVAAVVGLALLMIPITRELIYQFYHLRTKVSDCFEQQAYFLEMNKAVIEANSAFSAGKKQSILVKQEKLREKLMAMANKLRINHAMSDDATQRALRQDNNLLRIDSMRREVSNSPLQLI